MKGGDLYEKTTAGTVSDPGDALGHHRPGRSSDTLSATAKLWTGKTCLKTWTIKGTGKIQTTKTATVSKGKTYKLTVDYTVNGVKQPQKSVTRTCS